MKTAICVIVKNEAELISEWIIHHSLIGFQSFIIIDDNSVDRTTDIALSLKSHIDIRVRQYYQHGEGLQKNEYLHICRLYADEFDWIAFIDADEFITLGDHDSIDSLLNDRKDSDAIAIPWLMYGSSGHVTKPQGLILESYLYRSEYSFGPNRHVKSIVRPEKVFDCYNPHAFEVQGKYSLPDGYPAIWTDNIKGLLAQVACYDSVKINHYFTRSLSHWQERLESGQLDSGEKRTLDDFAKYDRNEVFDDSALPYAIAVRAFLDGLS
jgi:glycosyltransferase involved in cell wall biosynthesis